jgi:tellurite resistance protein
MTALTFFFLTSVAVVGTTLVAAWIKRPVVPRVPPSELPAEVPPRFDGEPKLKLSEAQAQAFMGALVALGRVDGVLSGPELAVLRAVAAHHGFALDEEALLSEEHDPSHALDLVRTVASTPFRQAAASAPAEVARGFLVAARRLASADGAPDTRADELLARFEQQLGESPTR